MSFYVYIIEGADGFLYTGLTGNLQKRLGEHNGGLCRLTKNRRPLVLRYKETFKTRGEAALRENQLKGLSRVKKVGLFSLR